MAAPTLTARLDPVGIKLDDGYRTTIAFERDPDVAFWEKSVTPPGIDGGDAIDTSTMHNDTYRTKAARALKELTDCTVRAAWDPKLYTQIVELINQEGSITLWLPDGTSVSFFGFLRSFIPGELVEGTPPEADITIVCTNQDPVTGDEEDPVVVEVVGT